MRNWFSEFRVPLTERLPGWEGDVARYIAAHLVGFSPGISHPMWLLARQIGGSGPVQAQRFGADEEG